MAFDYVIRTRVSSLDCTLLQNTNVNHKSECRLNLLLKMNRECIAATRYLSTYIPTYLVPTVQHFWGAPKPPNLQCY